ncbi:MAG: flavodoxin family protein [Spirochaetia bacterium]|jgi:multimeric flavodoxin WrbA|nr:flavodoxin family protein [Spirochaetia bacterium]
MKALGIVSSPRQGGNSELAIKEILSQLPSSWEKEMIRLNELNLEYCTACYSCIPEDKQCKLNDDLSFLIEHVKQADKIAIGCPSYFLGGHTALKLALDRLLSILTNFRAFEHKDCVLAASYGIDRYDGAWKGAVKEDMIIFARAFNLNIVDSAVILATVPGDSVEGENLNAVRRLAQSLQNPPERPYTEKGELDCPYCTSGAVTLFADGKWICRICGGTGTIEKQNDGFALKIGPENHSLFNDAGKMSHAVYLADKKKLFLANRDKVRAIQSKYADLDWWVKP